MGSHSSGFRAARLLALGAAAAAGALCLPAPRATATVPAGWVNTYPPSPKSPRVTLDSVTAISSTDVWAVGHYWWRDTKSGGSLPYGPPPVLHWNGTRWTRPSIPQPAADHGYLISVSAANASSVWAIGTQGGASGMKRPWLLHYTAGTWKAHGTAGWASSFKPDQGVVLSSNNEPGSRQLLARPGGVVWVAGQVGHRAAAERWLHGRWQLLRAPLPAHGRSAFDALAPVPGSGRVLGIGSNWGTQPHPYAAVWTGSRWKPMSFANRVLGEANAAVAFNNHSAWLTGYRSLKTSTATLAAHWNGSRWRAVSSPSRNGAALYALAANGPSDIWASGHWFWGNGCSFQACGERSFVMHYDGSTWTRVPSPNPNPWHTNVGPDSYYTWFSGLASAPDTGELFAVGGQGRFSFSSVSPVEQDTMAYRYTAP